MNNLNIDSYNSELTIKQGEHCGVKYYGDNDVKVYRTKDTLYIKSINLIRGVIALILILLIKVNQN